MTEGLALACRPDKRQVALSFSRAAASYDSVAALQRDVGQHLMLQLHDLAPQRWLDLGSGTGYFTRQLQQRYPQAQGVALDIAEGMLQYARQQGMRAQAVLGDAEHLPLAANSLDLIYSSLALQWCADFSQVLAEAQRVLRPGGRLVFSSLVQGTLYELQNSWRAVDQQVHVNHFRHFDDYLQLCAHSGLRVCLLERKAQVLHFANVRALTRELKALGAQNLNQGRANGLHGRSAWGALQAAYEHYRQPLGLPATYQVVYGVLQKTEQVQL